MKVLRIFPMIPMIMALNSVSVFKDAVFYMMKDFDWKNKTNKDI